jgi:hypothetical protein
MALPQNVQWKFYHAVSHFNALREQLERYYQTNPCKIVRQPNSPSNAPLYDIVASEEIPARFGLIAGDFLQNLRSTLDYLVWELVLANSQTPDKKNMFPVCLTEKSFKDAIKSERLRGVADKPLKLIDSLQPYRVEESMRAKVPLAVLDELVNINKHRRVVLTKMQTYMSSKLPEFESVTGEHWSKTKTFRGKKHGVPGQSIDPKKLEPNSKPIAFIALGEGPADDVEIVRAMDLMAIYIGEDILKQFQSFF